VRTIDDFTAGMNFAQFRENPKTVAAMERKVLVIGEAAVRLDAKLAESSRTCRGAKSVSGKSASARLR